MLTFAREALLERMAAAKERIWLSSPFISNIVAGEICEAAAKSKAVDKRLLTDLNERSVRCGVLDPEPFRGFDAAVSRYVTRTSTIAELPPFGGVPLEVAGKGYLSVENGCELTRPEFEQLARATQAKAMA